MSPPIDLSDEERLEWIKDAEVLSPAFADAALALQRQAKRFGESFRMLDDGTIVDVETFDAIRNRWPQLPSAPPSTNVKK